MATFVDSSVFLYAESFDDKKRDIAVQSLAKLYEADTMVISPQVVGEVCVNLQRAVGSEAADMQVAVMLETSRLQPLDARTTREATRIRKRYGFDYWDSQILAAAVASGAQYLMTEDLQDGQIIDGVTVVNPFRPGFETATRES